MERINMKYNRLKELLDVCELEELDSFDLLLNYVEKYDLTNTNRSFNKIYGKKWDKGREELEGINEYDAITRAANFDISELIEYATNPYELIYLKKLMEAAKEKIEKDLEKTKTEEEKDKIELELRILPNIEKSLKRIIIYLNQYISIDNMITESELETMFNKFNIAELEAFDDIFEFVEEHNIEKMIDVSNKVRDNKIDKASKEYEVSIKPYNFDIFNLSSKKYELSRLELEFLCTIIDDSITGLIRYKEEYDRQLDKDYITLENSLINLKLSYKEELDCRRGKTLKKTR